MLNISMRQMHTLLAIQRHGKISAAAKSLGLTSPAVTLQLQQLEQELGCQLVPALQVRRATDRDRRDRD
jgi:DNA-binding transcriptional LysR family regulator